MPKFRLLHGKFHSTEGKPVKAGGIVELTEGQAKAYKDMIEPYRSPETAAKVAKVVAEAEVTEDEKDEGDEGDEVEKADTKPADTKPVTKPATAKKAQ